MLEEALLSDRDAASIDDLLRHIEPALLSAAAKVSASSAAATLLSDDPAAKQPLLDAVRAAANAAAFSSGIDILPPFQLELQSPTLERERLEAVQRRLAERRAAGQLEHVQRTGELLQRFQSLRQSAPELSAGALLERLSASDRSTMLEALLLAAADGEEPQALWAVAGSALVRLADGESAAKPQTEVIELPGALGPMRSVQSAVIDNEPVLLIGARSGVIIARRDDPSAVRVYEGPESTSPLGYNSAVAWEGKLFATHRATGLVVWAVDRPGPPLEVICDDDADSGVPPGFANLRLVGPDRLFYSRGGEVRGRTRDGEIVPVIVGPEPVVAIVPRGQECIVVSADGTVVAYSTAPAPSRPPVRRCGRVRAAALLPWIGEGRLLLATEDGPVCCVGVDDSLVTQYASPHRGLKALAASSALVAGLTGDRQRIVLWQSWDGTRPAAELHLGAVTKHRVADLCFA